MSRQSVATPQTSRQRCNQCMRPLRVCYCARIPGRQNNSWPVVIVQDVRESGHAIGTARMTALSLSDCQLMTINPDNCIDSPALDALRLLQPVLIYPGENACDMATLAALPKAPLLFIDASWRRSRKILHTQPWIAQLPRYALNMDASSRYRIRQQPTPSSLSTLEAVVYTLQQLEPDPGRFDTLLATMDWVINQQIKHMGSDIWQSNYQKNR
ncbi:MAG: DTW domain-containing protein [Gammaproteobacteria bacterium]|nr:DTW domain-containing protein [Gammaproteobacteria bacterium]